MNKREYLLNLAKAVSLRATCPDLKVGCVIASKDFHVLTTGYNGVPHGHSHCRARNGRCLENGPSHRAMHAEQNCIAYAARKGIALEGSVAYLTHKPCQKCRILMEQAGIRKVVYARV